MARDVSDLRVGARAFSLWSTAVRDISAAAITLLAIAAHLLRPQTVSLASVGALVTGLVAGLVLATRHAARRPRTHPEATQVVAQDIQTLRQAFDVLRRQVGTTIDSSEKAVMAMTERMGRVHRQADALRANIVEAVERSHSLSAESLASADRHGEAVAALGEHQHQFDRQQQENQARVGAVAERVRRLVPLVAMVSDISRQTNMLSINASIEAARAGPEGAGFKIVATEVRRLSAQTADVARQISEGITSAAATIDTEVGLAARGPAQGTAGQLGEIADHIRTMSRTLGDVVPYLGELSGQMDSGMAVVTEDIINTLGDMQFQDINRQLLQQIDEALGSLSDHFAQIYQLIDGQAPPPPVLLEELLSRWTENYVMHSQRLAHSVGVHGASGAEAAPAAGDLSPAPAMATANGPRIELF